VGRGLPWSVLLHVIVLTLVVLHGNTVQRKVIQPPLLMRARLVTPQMLAQPAAETVAAPEPEAAPPRVEPVPLPPKEVPKVQPERKPEPKPEPKPVAPKPEPKPAAQPDSRSEAAADLQQGQAQPALSGASIRGTDSDFPFAWYIATVESQIARNWHTKQFNFGARAKVSCAVHFVIGRNGTIAQVSMVESSGVGVYDREALRAVQATRLPPLPPQYGGSTLGITFIFNQVQEM
jgi:TonB family protein